jgi:hypothetical protein
MNIPESRDFVIKHRPNCCNEKVNILGCDLSNKRQYFVCRKCYNKYEIKYWPLYQEDIRELKLNSIL